MKWEKSTEGREGKGERAAGCGGGGGLRVKGWQWERGVLRRGEDGGTCQKNVGHSNCFNCMA